MTTTITAIEDAFIVSSGDTNKNFGATGYFFIGRLFTSYINRAVMRVDATKIPQGKITAVRLYIYKAADANSLYDGYINCFKVKDANTWVVGTANGAVQAGSVCYAYAKYDTQAWAGGSNTGCGVSGTDYFTDSNPPSTAFTAAETGWKVVNLKPHWFSEWRDNVGVNNGFVIKETEETNNKLAKFLTREGANKPYIEIDTVTSMNKVHWRGIT